MLEYAYAQFCMPQTMYYGRGSLAELGNQAALLGSKALLISDRIMEQLGNVQRCLDALKQQGVASATYLDVNTEPTDSHVAEAARELRAHHCDVIVALGGGSCIDTAKAVSVAAANDAYIGDFARADKPIANRPVPVIAIPTTAGTGSEVTSVTVIINTASDVKMMIKRPEFMPAAAIVDPLLTLSVPAQVTAATGLDALCHALEAYISRRSQPMTDHLALSAIKLIVENIAAVCENGSNVEARERMMLASMQAGLAFSNASVTLVHGMSRPLGALFHVPHGLSNAMLLPVVLAYTRESAVKRLADIARHLHPELSASADDNQLADLLLADINRLHRGLAIPNPREWGIDEFSFNRLIDKMATDALASGSPANHPLLPTHDEIAQLYRQCYNYAAIHS